MRLWLLLILSCFSCTPALYAQSRVKASDHADCSKAFDITDSTAIQFSAPHGYGSFKEFSGNGWDDLIYLEAEHNSVWVKFESKFDCQISFTVKPDEPTDDYDFLLWEVQSNEECKGIANKSLIPIRSNMARQVPSKGGFTGLSTKSQAPYVKSGPGSNFSSIVHTHSGKQYVLLIDRVKATGNGFTLQIENCQYKSLMSDFKKVFAQDSAPATIFVKEKGFTIQPGSFLASPGDTIVLDDIRFFSLQSVAMEPSKPELDSLAQYLKLNPDLYIRLHGHTNTNNETKSFNCMIITNPAKDIFDERAALPKQCTQRQLSAYRAIAVKNYLVQQGVPSDRIQTLGWGGTRKKFENPVDRKERQLNMRVEVEVLEQPMD